MRSINIRTLFLNSVASLLFVSGCATEPVGNSGFTSVSGSAAYRQRIAMSPNAVLNVRIEDVSRADAKSQIIAESKEAFGNRQVPIGFSLQIPNNAIDPSRNYNLRATITDNGQLRFMTNRSYPVLTHGNPAKVDVILDAVTVSKSGISKSASEELFQSGK